MKWKFLGDRLQVPVVKLISIARCRWPSTLNCGSDTSLDTPTELGPSFHLYRMSLIVYPTVYYSRDAYITICMYALVYAVSWWFVLGNCHGAHDRTSIILILNVKLGWSNIHSVPRGAALVFNGVIL